MKRGLRAVVQYVFAANAGAAAALMSYMTAMSTSAKSDNSTFLHGIVRSLGSATGIFLGGVFFVLLSLIFLGMAKQRWGHFWEEMTNMTAPGQTVQADFNNRFARSADRFDRIGAGTLLMSAFLFIPGSAMAVYAFVSSI